MELHYKLTCWATIKIKGDIDTKEVIDILKKGIHPIDIIEDDLSKPCELEWEILTETEEQITPEENNFQPTIELMDYDDNNLLKCIWDNTPINK